jgi:hypothetical protein
MFKNQFYLIKSSTFFINHRSLQHNAVIKQRQIDIHNHFEAKVNKALLNHGIFVLEN